MGVRGRHLVFFLLMRSCNRMVVHAVVARVATLSRARDQWHQCIPALGTQMPTDRVGLLRERKRKLDADVSEVRSGYDKARRLEPRAARAQLRAWHPATRVL